MRLLLVEDDAEIADLIGNALRREGYQVEIESTGDQGLDQALYGEFGLVVLDVMLPGMDGWTILGNLRKHRVNVPVLMLTARDSVEDRIKGLEGGADDYLAKPFDVRELIARVRALIRRDKVHKSGAIQIADLTIDTRAHVVTRGGQEIRLTPREFTLLEALARNEGRTLTRQVILESVWDNEESLEGSVNFHITSLRKKVDAGFDEKLIHTVHGIGYVLRSPS